MYIVNVISFVSTFLVYLPGQLSRVIRPSPHLQFRLQSNNLPEQWIFSIGQSYHSTLVHMSPCPRQRQSIFPNLCHKQYNSRSWSFPQHQVQQSATRISVFLFYHTSIVSQSQHDIHGHVPCDNFDYSMAYWWRHRWPMVLGSSLLTFRGSMVVGLNLWLLGVNGGVVHCLGFENLWLLGINGGVVHGLGFESLDVLGQWWCSAWSWVRNCLGGQWWCSAWSWVRIHDFLGLMVV
jgi:hypothetical protein